jgi:hypothetical protein
MGIRAGGVPGPVGGARSSGEVALLRPLGPLVRAHRPTHRWNVPPLPVIPETSVYRIAADIGGTFTDIALLTRDGRLSSAKLLSTPANYADAVIDGVVSLVRRQGLDIQDIVEVLHGCTVATNAILERKGLAFTRPSGGSRYPLCRASCASR